MIISHGRGYIFVHIPKTGGTSLALALEARAMKDDILIGDTPKARNRRSRLKTLTPAGRLWKHSTLADIDGIITPEELPRMRIVTLVRNPWDRLVSYYHWLRMQNFDHRAVTLAQNLDFADFIAHAHTQSSIRAWPYGRYVTDAQGREHQTAFLRIEHLQQDIAPFETHLGFSLEIPHANQSDRGDYRAYYNRDTSRIVANICATDIARFDYRFD